MNKYNGTSKIVIIYAVLGCTWIYFSDTALSWLIRDQEIIAQIALFKGLLFVAFTSVLLFFLINRLSDEIKQSANALRANEKRLRLLVKNSSDSLVIIDADGSQRYVSPAAERITGFPIAELKRKTLDTLIHPDDMNDVRAAWNEAVKHPEKTVTVQYRHIHKTRGWVFSEAIAQSFLDESTINGIIASVRDITEHKRVEELLRESEDKFRLTFAFSPDAVNINRLDDGMYVDINEGFTQTTGFTRDDVMGKTSTELGIWHDPGDRQQLVKGLREKGFFENLETQFRKKDGSLLTGLMSARILSLKGVPHIISITRDITVRKKHEKEQLKIEKLESLGLLAGGIAHDFNNILTALMGNISVAKVFIETTHKSYVPLSEAEKATVRAGDLAHQLLTFSRGGEPVKKVVSLQHLVHEALSFTLHGSNVKGTVEIPDSIHAIEADEGQINQVFQNIIINATQAMPGGGELKITAKNDMLEENNTLSIPQGSYVRLSFADQGCGISKDHIKRIFDPYFTTKSAGIGLGLSSVHSIVGRHGGHIKVSSVPGEGTTLTVHLPSTGKAYTEQQASTAVEEIVEHQGGSILVMDDDEMIRNVASSMLAHLGYEVTVCARGEEAIELYKTSMESETPFLMVIMDLTIPGGLGGKQAAEQILSLYPNACLIVSSGYSDDPIMSNFRDFGFSGMISKPYTMLNFEKVLKSLLAQR